MITTTQALGFLADVQKCTDDSIRRVVCAAIRNDKGHLVIGVRHYSPDMYVQISLRSDGHTFLGRHDKDQGFVDQWGNYLTREEAWEVAVRNGQIHREVSSPGRLYSENLY